MQEYWEVYMKPLEGHPATVSFNAGISDNFADETLPFVGFVKVPLKHPNELGTVDSQESDELSFIEDRLEMESLRYRIGSYVGRIVTQGTVTFVFYLKYDFEWPDAVKSAMQHFESYDYEIGSRSDETWEVYDKLLFPTPKEWQIIHNHHTCNQLQAEGDNLRLERAIEHTAYFETPQQRSAFQDFFESEGFKMQKHLEPSPETTPFFGVVFYRKDIPHYYEIDALTLALIDHAKAHGGEYDGWETSLVKI